MRLRRFDMIVSIVCLALLGYFGWHAYKGPRGFPYRDRLQAQVAQLEKRYAELDGERLDLRHRAVLMRPDSIDPDMLDEMARRILDMVGPNDYVAFLPKQNPVSNP